MLGQASFECGDPPFLLLDNGEQLQDQLAHDERGLFPTGGIQRNPGWQREEVATYPHVTPLEAL